ncbi:hypothetical protein [Shewanella dokdonensis]|uniref:Uncharacterized protein n=1 Tax=Shewanella dokdonensis TaxID=712036 RepID=A0ABX8DB00_9GAMM|nr:hypothetical protein [Shewanella dokdonensis]MCL1075307.1 hypothetical protein [Shewanella dokdonensis]QVK22024.1 hypothetical protein KHX94_11075 [Shewanella dokdonensis]
MSLPIEQYLSVPIPESLYLALAQHYPTGVAASIANILSDHLANKDENARQEYSGEGSFQWAQLTLPHKTQLRTKYYGKYLIADIINGKLIWNSKSYLSVSELINTMRGGTRNNAWRCTEIKYPNETSWLLADRLRSHETKRFPL